MSISFKVNRDNKDCRNNIDSLPHDPCEPLLSLKNSPCSSEHPMDRGDKDLHQNDRKRGVWIKEGHLTLWHGHVLLLIFRNVQRVFQAGELWKRFECGVTWSSTEEDAIHQFCLYLVQNRKKTQLLAHSTRTEVEHLVYTPLKNRLEKNLVYTPLMLLLTYLAHCDFKTPAVALCLPPIALLTGTVLLYILVTERFQEKRHNNLGIVSYYSKKCCLGILPSAKETMTSSIQQPSF